MMRPLHLNFCFFLFFISYLSCQYSFFMLIIYTTLAAGRVLFALTEKSTWVLITRISFLFLPINKTNHALILLLCHQGEVHFCSRASMFGFPSVPVRICRWWPWHKYLKWNIASQIYFKTKMTHILSNLQAIVRFYYSRKGWTFCRVLPVLEKIAKS